MRRVFPWLLLVLCFSLCVSALVQGRDTGGDVRGTAGDVRAPQPPARESYTLRSVGIMDAAEGEGPKFVWVLDAWPFKGFQSLSSPRLREWVGALPAGTEIAWDYDKTAPNPIARTEEALEFGRYCRSKGLVFRPIPG